MVVMRIIWSDFASKSLSSIYKYYKIEAGEKVADKLRKEIFEATKQLIRYPGQTHLIRFNGVICIFCAAEPLNICSNVNM